MGPFQVVIDNSPPLFFIDNLTSIPPSVLYKERKELTLKSLSGTEVDALYFNNHNDLYNGKKTIKEVGFRCYESDVVPEERYLMERFIYGSVDIEGSPITRDGMLCFTNVLMKPCSYKPNFKVLSVDIETGRDGSIYSFGMDTNGDGFSNKKVLMRNDALDSVNQEDYITYYPSEKMMILDFIKVFNSLDPDIIIGWHVIGFDLDFIRRRAEFYNIQLKIGRGGTTPLVKQLKNNSWICDITGRVVIDGPPTLRGAFYTFENYKLESVAKEVLGAGKDITGTGKVDEIERRFRADKKALVHYNLLDCTLVTDIYNKLGLIDLTFTRAITCGLAMDKIGMSVAAFDYVMLPKVHRKGFVAPDVEDIVSTGQGGGGLVFIKEPGFYNNIVVLDFKSLYPSIIRTFFIDPISRILSDTDQISTPVGIKFSSSQHILPSYIESLMNKRELAKKNKDLHLSQAIKILMNSFYGVMGTTGSRFYHQDLPDSITGTGQWLLTVTKEFLEGDGYTVIYGDTDSLFVQLKPTETPNPDNSGLGIVDVVNSYLKALLKKEFGVDSILELEYEKHFSKFFLPGVRGGLTGAKKRYAGIISNSSGEELTFTGLEFVRSDWTKLAKEFQFDLFTKIFAGEDITQYVIERVKRLRAGELDNQLVYNKRLAKPASEYTKIIPPPVKAALLLDPTGNMRGRIEYIVTKDGPIPVDLKPMNIDYDHYIDKQLKPIADSVLPYINKDFQTIVFDKQPELF